MSVNFCKICVAECTKPTPGPDFFFVGKASCIYEKIKGGSPQFSQQFAPIFHFHWNSILNAAKMIKNAKLNAVNSRI